VSIACGFAERARGGKRYGEIAEFPVEICAKKIRGF
jgi:hypothetical protein